MKHYLNFKPTIVFRKGSRFMLKNSLFILYLLPLLMLLFSSYQYYSAVATAAVYEDHKDMLATAIKGYAEENSRLKPDLKKFEEIEQFYFDYRRLSAASRASWSGLFDELESLTPEGMKFRRFMIRPDKLVKLVIEGEARSIEFVTAFLRTLYREKAFVNPALLNHRSIKDKGMVAFSLEVDYLGERGELP